MKTIKINSFVENYLKYSKYTDRILAIAQTKVDTTRIATYPDSSLSVNYSQLGTSGTLWNLNPSWWTITNNHELFKGMPRNNKPDFSDGAIIIINKRSHINYINKHTIVITN